jgi:cell division septum initiation protein DivIVA
VTYTTTRKPYVPRYPVQALRGLPLQPLRGLGEITPEEKAVVDGMDRILAVAHEQTQKVVESAGIFVKGAAREWARNIVDQTNGLRSRMIAVSKNGRLFFVDQPAVAQRLLEDHVKFLAEQVSEFQQSAYTTSAVGIMQQSAQETIAALAALAKALAKGAFNAAADDPTGALLLGGAVVVGIFLYLKLAKLSAKAATAGLL